MNARTLALFASALLAGVAAPQNAARADELTGATISTPESGGAAAAGALVSVDPTSGSLHASYSFDLLTARGAVQPTLSLGYSSSAGIREAGYGWGIVGTATIERRHPSGARGMPTYVDPPDPVGDRMYFGETPLVPICIVGSGACAGNSDERPPGWANGWMLFRAEVEGIFARFFWSPDRITWVVQFKSGETMELGAPRDASYDQRGLYLDEQSRYLQWNVVRRYDTHASLNRVVYAWDGLDHRGHHYLTDIYDTPDASKETHFAHRTHLDYEDRQYVPVSLAPTGYAAPLKKLTQVTITSASLGSASRELVRKYHLRYVEDTFQTVLFQIQKEGRCTSPVAEATALAGPTYCPTLPSTTVSFSWPPTPTVTTIEGPSPDPGDGPIIVDVNSDGLPDIVVPAVGVINNPQQTVYLNNIARLGRSEFTLKTMFVTPPSLGATPTTFLSQKLADNVIFGNFNGDARLNVIWRTNRSFAIFSPFPFAGGPNFSWNGVAANGLLPQELGLPVDQQPIHTFGDVDGDGIVDMVSAGDADYLSTRRADGTITPLDRRLPHLRETLPTGDSQPFCDFGYHDDAPSDWIKMGQGDTRAYFVLADMNGDGVNDRVEVQEAALYQCVNHSGKFIANLNCGAWECDWCAGNWVPTCTQWQTKSSRVSLTVRPGLGHGTFGSEYLAHELGPSDLQNDSAFKLLEDLNGDGLADLVLADDNGIVIQWGIAWNDGSATITKFSNAVDRSFGSALIPGWDRARCMVRAADMDGSGTNDLVVLCPGGTNAVTYKSFDGGQATHKLLTIDNGVGAFTTVTYGSSTLHVPASTNTARTLPQPFQLVTNVKTVNGLPGAKQEQHWVEYAYAEPVFDGLQEQFRGFREVTVRPLGGGPGARTHTTYLIRSCDDAPGQPCPRTIDRPSDALRGLPTLVEASVFGYPNDAYHSTKHFRYQLRTLFTGMDGRRVRFAYPDQVDTYLYDTSPFTPSSSSETLSEVIAPQEPSLESTVAVPLRAVPTHLRTRRTINDFGNETDAWDDGRIGVDLPIHTTRTWQSTGQDGWWFRVQNEQTDGNGSAPGRRLMQVHYDDAGQPYEVDGWLEGSVELDRRHEISGMDTAPPPPNAAALVPGWVRLAHYTYDAWGHITHAVGPNGRCRDQSYDPLFNHVIATRTIFAGRQVGDCGETALTTFHFVDRGLEKEFATTSPTLALTVTKFDGFGRVIEVQRPSDAPHVNVRVEYPTVAAGPVQIVHASVSMDGVNYKEGWTYHDGFGRTVLTLQQADPNAGDGGNWIVSGLPDRDATGHVIREYEPGYYSGSPSSYPLSASPSSRFRFTYYDDFGRVIRTNSVDGPVTSSIAYHATSVDRRDERQVALGLPPTTTISDGHGRTIRTQRLLGNDTKDTLIIDATYWATGEVGTIDQYHTGGADPHIIRTLEYDSFGRLVRNTEPNTSGYFIDPVNLTATLKTWRYAYDYAGDLVGTSDARGCGKNIFYDAAGRMIAEDYSPCLESQALYSPIQTAGGFVVNGEGTETYHVYDAAEAAEPPSDFGGNAVYLMGRLAASYDRGAHTRLAYDVRGRATTVARQIAQPGDPDPVLANRYAANWYRTATTYDDADRVVDSTTGADVQELLVNQQSRFSPVYSARGLVTGVKSSYGTLTRGTVADADGFVRSQQFGDVAGTVATFIPDARRRVGQSSVRRSMPGGSDPITRQSVLAANTYGYAAGVLTTITDDRDPSEWLDGAKPVNRKMTYDGLGQLRDISYQYSTTSGGDLLLPPLQAESQNPTLGGYVPFHSPPKRVQSQWFGYDWAGNLTYSADDASAFWERSFGTATMGNGTGAAPNRLTHASGTGGTVDVAYDLAGNIVDLVVTRDPSQCADNGMCVHRFVYDWDEVGRLARARRWDSATPPPPPSPPPPPPPPPPCGRRPCPPPPPPHCGRLPCQQRPTSSGESTQASAAPVRPTTHMPNADQAFVYDESDMRVLKVAYAHGHVSWVNAEIFPTLRLDHASYDRGDYERTAFTESVYLAGGLARLLYAPSGVPSLGRALHVLIEVGDHLGATSIVIDKDTSELVERATYLAYGATESDYRPTRWNSFRERYRLSGKEEDLDIGLTYFGARYYVAGLGRWASADPLAIHALGGDLNPYAYVTGSPLMRVDPLGLSPCDGSENVASSGAHGIHALSASTGCDHEGGKADDDPRVDPAPPDASPRPQQPMDNSDPRGSELDDPTEFRPPEISLSRMQEVSYSIEFSGEDFGKEAFNSLLERGVEQSLACMTTWCVSIPGLTSAAADAITGGFKFEGSAYVNGNSINGSKIAAQGAVIAVEMAATMGAGGLGAGARAAADKVGYSVAAEVRLPVSLWGRSASVHENASNAILHDRLLANRAYRAIMEELIPGITNSVSSVGGRATPSGWIWHHELESGLMRLVPEAQHTPGSEFWRALHPFGFGGYASWGRAFGAPQR